ncbi:lysophospholipid acyltransferase family protein [Prochlorococcus marinus]|uniref:Putative 1-acyl-sn-glycerol-3-phosphate acyltransferase n=1 Tax=Prochlorococcus marinus (strain MIT 9211) TaxID=93059 RepID=A9BCZ5_PROM4|nr:lysophospholipid acyltransferase family protein [Prochlorococcus marinus]ABX08083.1 putative 1-acyl-sn-glycerol-3-phosphate acyltransferase [Prochlorococcus marinus str. MIT 9211]
MIKELNNNSRAHLLPPRQSLVYAFISYCIVFPIFRIFFRGRISGIQNVPLQGSLVIVANHASHLDPPLLGHALGRPIAFMAKQELFRIPILGWIIRACGAYPVSRGASDREAIRVASERLHQGWATGVFLDGTRQENGRVNNPMAGAALLAARTNSQILPVAIINSHRALGKGMALARFVPIHLRIGNVISPPVTRKKIDLLETTKQVQISINTMIEQGLIVPKS